MTEFPTGKIVPRNIFSLLPRRDWHTITLNWPVQVRKHRHGMTVRNYHMSFFTASPSGLRITHLKKRAKIWSTRNAFFIAAGKRFLALAVSFDFVHSCFFSRFRHKNLFCQSCETPPGASGKKHTFLQRSVLAKSEPVSLKFETLFSCSFELHQLKK